MLNSNTHTTPPLILLVDDKPQIAKVISIYLGKYFRTEYCSNGKQALERLQQDELPDLIITDINMPNVDGYQLVESIKSNEQLKNIPIIVLSSIESSADRVRLLKLGVTDYMLKPFNPEELKLRINKSLNIT